MQEMVPKAFFMQKCATFGVCDFDMGLSAPQQLEQGGL